MKKIKNKFILFIISLVLIIIWSQLYNVFVYAGVDRNSYVSLVNGEWLINNYKMQLEKKYKLKPKDNIKTIWKDSLAIIKWWDWSITRLWWNSELVVKQADVSDDLIDIKIIFKLNRWKTWSDIISFVWWNSYFYQEFADTTAAVRWTIYEVNLEKDYVYVSSHEVSLRKNWKEKILKQNEALDIKKFFLIDLFEFIKKYKDSHWQNLNKALDKEFYKNLVKQVQKLNNLSASWIANLSDLSEKQKKELYKVLKKQYQQLNFLKPDSPLYNQKLLLKKYLIQLAPPKEKQDLILTSLYDFNDILNSKKYNFLKINLEVLWKNIKEIKDVKNINFYNYINSDLIKKIEIPEWLQDEFQKNFNNISKVFDIWEIDLSNNKITEFIDYSTKNFQNQINKTWILQKIKDFFTRNSY